MAKVIFLSVSIDEHSDFTLGIFHSSERSIPVVLSWGVSQNELNLHNAQWSSPTNFNCVPPKQKLSALREALWDRAFFVGLRLHCRSCISSISFFFWALVKQCSVEETLTKPFCFDRVGYVFQHRES